MPNVPSDCPQCGLLNCTQCDLATFAREAYALRLDGWRLPFELPTRGQACCFCASQGPNRDSSEDYFRCTSCELVLALHLYTEDQLQSESPKCIRCEHIYQRELKSDSCVIHGSDLNLLPTSKRVEILILLKWNLLGPYFEWPDSYTQFQFFEAKASQWQQCPCELCGATEALVIQEDGVWGLHRRHNVGDLSWNSLGHPEFRKCHRCNKETLDVPLYHTRRGTNVCQSCQISQVDFHPEQLKLIGT